MNQAHSRGNYSESSVPPLPPGEPAAFAADETKQKYFSF
jgi:hypothetical protein